MMMLMMIAFLLKWFFFNSCRFQHGQDLTESNEG